MVVVEGGRVAQQERQAGAWHGTEPFFLPSRWHAEGEDIAGVCARVRGVQPLRSVFLPALMPCMCVVCVVCVQVCMCLSSPVMPVCLQSEWCVPACCHACSVCLRYMSVPAHHRPTSSRHAVCDAPVSSSCPCVPNQTATGPSGGR